jgi:hypothetical protein
MLTQILVGGDLQEWRETAFDGEYGVFFFLPCCWSGIQLNGGERKTG